ncbi:MAG: MBL fold metallo-hydrolase, partial [Lactobacillus iners]|nr:MBL fold metallo-hydrolase [Lactobacillus iners]
MNLKHKTKVTFYNGLTTIGGPMIEVAYNDSHVLFDLGEVFKPDLELADESFQTLIDNQLIGDVPDFYDYHLTGKKLSDSHWKASAAYISHVHLDHSKALNLLDESVKLYTGPITASMLPVLNKDGNYLLPAAGKPKNYTRPIIAADLNVPIKVGDITLEIVPSDHDAYGATGLIIKTPDKKIAYTGDIRLHGYHPEWVEAFMHKGHGCDMLIIESTALSWPNENHSEEFTGPKNEDELIDRIVQY